jgi:pyruvate/2-oxoglutarate dehydrogenase complex dihydrolipoamide acyltransferase (E2) component
MLMLLELSLSLINPHMTHARVDAILASPGTKVAVGQAILELTVDLSDQFSHDCPPVSHYRVCASEAAWLRHLAISAGDKVAVGALVATFTKIADEVTDDGGGRPLRTTVVGVTRQWQPW